jgi:hypothetical protein
VLTAFGAAAVTFMMLMYALEHRGPRFVLAFACGCALSSIYGFLAGTWPFGVVEAIWSVIALRRYRDLRSNARVSSPSSRDPENPPLHVETSDHARQGPPTAAQRPPMITNPRMNE